MVRGSYPGQAHCFSVPRKTDRPTDCQACQPQQCCCPDGVSEILSYSCSNVNNIKENLPPFIYLAYVKTMQKKKNIYIYI